MFKKTLIALLLVCLIAFTIVACGSTSTTVSTSEIHTSNQSFSQPSITIQKGHTFTLISDTSASHIIQNGSWVNGAPQALKEPGAPIFGGPLNGNSQQVAGPFTTAGTYHFYCTIHPGMNLTVIVQ